jgi:hypothetical protein
VLQVEGDFCEEVSQKNRLLFLTGNGDVHLHDLQKLLKIVNNFYWPSQKAHLVRPIALVNALFIPSRLRLDDDMNAVGAVNKKVCDTLLIRGRLVHAAPDVFPPGPLSITPIANVLLQLVLPLHRLTLRLLRPLGCEALLRGEKIGGGPGHNQKENNTPQLFSTQYFRNSLM